MADALPSTGSLPTLPMLSVMPKCLYCGKSAGLFRRFHKECKAAFEDGNAQLKAIFRETLDTAGSIADRVPELQRIADAAHINQKQRIAVYREAYEDMVSDFLDDDMLSEDEENRLMEFKDALQLGQAELDAKGSFSRVVMAGTLRDLQEGKQPKRINLGSSVPFLFQKSEYVIWVFTGVDLYEPQTRTEYHGGSQGVSFRVAKGVYYRTGSFKGRPVKITELKHQGTGMLALTNKQFYYNGGMKAFKLPYNKLVTMEVFEDGLRMQKDGVRSKPQTFSGVDGWFVQNAVNLVMSS